jgi:hypothetical protein
MISEPKRNLVVRKQMLEDLIASIREGAAVLRGERKPSRRFVFNCSEARRPSGPAARAVEHHCERTEIGDQSDPPDVTP